MVNFTLNSIFIYTTVGLLISALGFISLNHEKSETLESIKQTHDPMLKLCMIISSVLLVTIFWFPIIVSALSNDNE